MFIEKQLSDKTINDINYLIENTELIHTDNFHRTINGFQSNNIVTIFSNEILKKILPDENNFIFHIHYIHYKKGGHQTRHEHSQTEKISFILYLNDSDGDTVFEEPINRSIKPEKGKLLLFDSNIWHYGKESFMDKKVLVGAISKIIRKY
tara:strand:+ start:487 stop:936 length:450 start_codon:yes stop_codon:yes gene_type:complete